MNTFRVGDKVNLSIRGRQLYCGDYSRTKDDYYCRYLKQITSVDGIVKSVSSDKRIIRVIWGRSIAANSYSSSMLKLVVDSELEAWQSQF